MMITGHLGQKYRLGTEIREDLISMDMTVLEASPSGEPGITCWRYVGRTAAAAEIEN